MNHVERFRAVMAGLPVDRLPMIEWAGWWDKTIDRWHGEGLPTELTDAVDIRSYFGLDPYRQFWVGAVGEPAPHQKALVGHVASTDDYLALRPALYGQAQAAGEWLRPWSAAQAAGELVVWLTLDGFFWFPRQLMGIERHLYAFYDAPELMHRINADLCEYNLSVVAGAAAACRPTFVTLAEDMSYNHGPMISPELFEEFLAPYYRRLVPALHELGAAVIVDSDGDVTALAPWLLAVGVDGVLPLERQAGVDGMALREAHPRLCMIGHFDKMTMPRGRGAMRAEFERLLPLMRSGRFVPSVDHQTPPGVSLAQYRQYVELLRRYAAMA